MNNDVLIFRTDRIGDLLVTCPAIFSIKYGLDKSKISLVTSEKNYVYAKKLPIFENVYLFPKNNLIKKISLLINLSKKNFKYVFVFDGKDRSVVSSIFVKSTCKIAVLPQKKNNLLYNPFKIKFIKDDEKTNLIEVFQQALNESDLNLKIQNFDFLYKKKNNLFSSKVPINNFVHIHLDEKWFNEYYIKKYTDINPSYEEFVDLINSIIKKKYNVVITTGIINLKLYDDLMTKFFIKENDNIYSKKYSNLSAYFINKPTFEDIESLLRNAEIFISCHCAVTHAANSFNLKIIDIIEESKKEWYSRFTLYIKEYKQIYRSKFSIIKNQLLSKIV